MSIMSLEALESTNYIIAGFREHIMDGLQNAVKPTPVNILDEVGKVGVYTVATVLKILGFRVECNKYQFEEGFSESFYQTEVYVGNNKIAITSDICILTLIEQIELLHKNFYSYQNLENDLWNWLINSDYPELQVELAECDSSIKKYILAATKPRCADEKFVNTLQEAGYTIQECFIMEESCVKCPCICIGEDKVKFIISDDLQDTIRAWRLRERVDILEDLKTRQTWKYIEESVNSNY